MNKIDHVKESLLSLRILNSEVSSRQHVLDSISHVLSEVTLSLLEEHQDGMNKFRVKELYWKLNVLEHSLSRVTEELEKDNDDIYDDICSLFNVFLLEEEW